MGVGLGALTPPGPRELWPILVMNLFNIHFEQLFEYQAGDGHCEQMVMFPPSWGSNSGLNVSSAGAGGPWASRVLSVYLLCFISSLKESC